MTVCILMLDGRMWIGWRGAHAVSIGILSVGSSRKALSSPKTLLKLKITERTFRGLLEWIIQIDVLLRFIDMCFAMQFLCFFHKKYWRIRAFVSIFQSEKLRVWFKLKMWPNGVTCILPSEHKQHVKSNKFWRSILLKNCFLRKKELSWIKRIPMTLFLRIPLSELSLPNRLPWSLWSHESFVLFRTKHRFCASGKTPVNFTSFEINKGKNKIKFAEIWYYSLCGLISNQLQFREIRSRFRIILPNWSEIWNNHFLSTESYFLKNCL